uniref:Ovule protein n=1 Tax=Steinernema glaseri TaxID=37863 RepID=A0A1I7Y4R6_9BILA
MEENKENNDLSLKISSNRTSCFIKPSASRLEFVVLELYGSILKLNIIPLISQLLIRSSYGQSRLSSKEPMKGALHKEFFQPETCLSLYYSAIIRVLLFTRCLLHATLVDPVTIL